ncbi:hypothetical protein FRC08_015439 [Ceratobasidium sp. 394]|nr:hypothetical protein FRC08_015439 [Ceratobasidium sp. 394]
MPFDGSLDSTRPALSGRARNYVNILKKPSDFAWKGELYDKEKNPDGIIKLSTAENSLLTKELLEYFNTHFELTPAHLKYRWTLQNSYEKSTRQVLPTYFNAFFNPRIKVLPEHCVHGDGIGSLLAQVFWALCEPGDGVLMATPYYDSYPRDIVYPAQAKVVPAYIPPSVDPLSAGSLSYLRAALENPESKIRAILFCNPHNPLATAYPQQMIIEYARLAEEFNVHLIVDEVYGLQVFSSRYVPDPTPFVSILSLDIQTLAGCNPARVHVIAGPTKDFGSSGLKVGSLISQHNPDLLLLVERAVQALPMSSASDALFTRVLSDVSFRDWFLEENRRRLSKAFEVVGDWCTYHMLPFVPASAGVFFVVDLAPILGRVEGPGASAYEQTVAGFKCMQNTGVYIVPMTISEDPIVTRYRMTFALPPETMLLALQRIEQAFGLNHWEPSI